VELVGPDGSVAKLGEGAGASGAEDVGGEEGERKYRPISF